STIGRKCCSKTRRVIPLGMTDFVGEISAAERVDADHAILHHPKKKILKNASQREGPVRVRSSIIRIFLVAQQEQGPAPAVLAAEESGRRPFGCLRSGIALPHAEHPWPSLLGYDLETDRLSASLRRWIPPGRATSHGGSSSPARIRAPPQSGSWPVAIL